MKSLTKKNNSIVYYKRANFFSQTFMCFFMIFLCISHAAAQVKINHSKFNYALTDSILTDLKPIYLKVINKDSTDLNYVFQFTGINCIITTNNKPNNFIRIDKSKNGLVKIYVKLIKNGAYKIIDSLTIFARNTQFQDYCHSNKCCMDSVHFQEYKKVERIIFRTNDSTEDGSEEITFDSSKKNWEKYQKIAWAYVIGCNKGQEFSNESDMTGGFTETLIVQTTNKTYTFKSADKELKCKSQILKILGMN